MYVYANIYNVFKVHLKKKQKPHVDETRPKKNSHILVWSVTQKRKVFKSTLI